jgi:hypothetical protein
MALEESCVYPQARARLQAGERHEMGREMAARRREHRAARKGGARERDTLAYSSDSGTSGPSR